jgi:hypothetical protein
MDPRHEVIGIVFIGNVKCVRIVGFQNIIRFLFSTLLHMMTPIPDRILWCYGEYQTLYGTVDGVDFQQGLPDLDTLDPREKHLSPEITLVNGWTHGMK